MYIRPSLARFGWLFRSTLTMSACSSGYPIHSNSSRALNSGSADLNIPKKRSVKGGLATRNMILTRHNIEHVTIVIRPMNPECFDPARKERIRLHSVENVECSVPVVGVLAEIKVNRAENTTKSDVAMEGRYEKPRAEEVSRDETRDLIPNLRWKSLGGGDA